MMNWSIRDNSISLESPVVMGILNVTPDSFYDGGENINPDVACETAVQMKKNGADIIDVGGESSRPGAKPVSAEEELRRVIPVIEKLSSLINLPIAIDTYKADVAEKAINAGASIVNDISAISDPEMAFVVKKYSAGIILMHKHGDPETMQNNPLNKSDVLECVISFLESRVQQAINSGIKKEQIVIDPGIGFGKTFAANEFLINNIDKLKTLGCPILIGASRKKFIGEITDRMPNERLAGSIAANIISYLRGAIIFRTHDVKETTEALSVAEAILLNN
ncbi:MAG: dihydropteroate synthase [Chlamydiae bacterium]|nr:MAG: dihydropteroate synthase [Chlamydiota bacterium]